MGIADELHRGFNKMSRAIKEKREVFGAFIELAPVAEANDAAMVIAGAAFCLLDSVAALENAGLLVEVEDGPWRDFLWGGHTARVSAFHTAMQLGDLPCICSMVSVMSRCIEANQHRLTFIGNQVQVTQ